MRTIFTKLLTILLVLSAWQLHAQTTVSIQANGTTGSYNTGSVNTAGTKNDGNMTSINTSSNRGFARFDLSTIPTGAVVTAASITFVTYSSTSSTANNMIYGFTGDPATIAGATLYTNCGSGSAFATASWVANASNTFNLNAAGLGFLTGNAGSTQVCLGFVRGSSNTYNIAGYSGTNGAVPTLSITYTVPTAPPACATYVSPANAATGLFTPVSLKWNATAGATAYDVYLGTSPSPTTLAGTVTDTVYSASGLATNTTYYWKVVPKNAIGSASGCTERSFTTAILSCVPTYVNGGSTDNITQVTLGTLSDVPPGNTSPFYFDRTGVQNAIPDIPMTIPSSLMLTFGTDGNQYSGVWVDFNNNGTFETSEFFSSNSNPGSSGTATIQITIPSTATLGNVYMRIRGGDDSQPTSAQACNASSSSYGMALDYKVNIVPAPSCAQPASVSSSNVAAQSATISWTASASAVNGYEYYYNTSGTAPTAATTASGNVGAGVLTANLMGLLDNTTHYFWVRSLCAAGAKSDWSNSGTFTTTCLPVATLPWTENFDGLASVGSTVFPSCWTKENGDWETTAEVAGGFSFYAGPHSAPYSLRNNWSATNEYMWTPGFQLTAGTSYDFSFYWAGDDYSGWQGDVFYNTTANSTGATQLGAAFVTPSTTTTMNYQKVVRSFVPATSGVYYFAIRVNEATGSPWYLGFDDFELKLTPSCAEPLSLSATLASASSADISWTAPASAPAMGYEYYYNTTGTPPTASSTPVYPVTTGTSATVSPLTTGLTYYFWVRSVCAAADKSLWSNMDSLIIDYCSPAPTSVDDSGIVNVISGSFSNPTGTEPNNYGNYSSMNINGPQGQNKNIDIVFLTDIYDYDAVIYVDWNNDLDFNDPGETVFTGLSAGSGSYDTVHASFLIPASATIGAHRMRIGGSDGGVPGPCYTGSWAAFEDYTLNVVSCAGLSVSLGADTTLCPAAGITLNAGNAGATYQWSTGATTQTLAVTTGNTYWVNVTTANGCVVSDTITVSYSTLPVVNLGADTTLCPAASISLNAGNAGATYLWSTGATSQSVSVSTAGTYWAKVTNATGCFATDTIVISAGTLPVVNLGNDTTICAGTTLTINAGNAGASYQWSTGAITSSIDVTVQGSYSVSVTNAAGCMASDTIQVQVEALPVVALGNDTAICANDTLHLDAGNAGADYLWSTGATTQMLEVTMDDTYYVTVTSPTGCVGSDTVVVTVNPLPSGDDITVTGTSPSFTFDVANGMNIDTYSWDFGDNTAGSANASPVHTYATTGTQTYEVTVTLTNECGSITLTKQVTVQGTGVGDIDQEDPGLVLYPNPASQTLTVENQSSRTMQEIHVYNLLGQQVARYTADPAQAKQVIDISHLANGMYHLRVQFAEGTVNRKFEILK